MNKINWQYTAGLIKLKKIRANIREEADYINRRIIKGGTRNMKRKSAR